MMATFLAPKIVDDDHATISISVDGEVTQSWVYSDDDDRRDKMRRAWCWCDGYCAAKGAELKRVGVPA